MDDIEAVFIVVGDLNGVNAALEYFSEQGVRYYRMNGLEAPNLSVEGTLEKDVNSVSVALCFHQSEESPVYGFDDAARLIVENGGSKKLPIPLQVFADCSWPQEWPSRYAYVNASGCRYVTVDLG
jgi:hypothetical protein